MKDHPSQQHPSNAAAPIDFLIVRNDLPIRWQRKIGLAPDNDLGVARRALFFALFTWLPLVIWAALESRLLDRASGEPLLVHYGVHVRCLVAIPLLILAEGMALRIVRVIVSQFLENGLIIDSQRDRFIQIVKDITQLRDKAFPWVIVFALTLLWLIGVPDSLHAHELSWATFDSGLGFGGWWFLYIVRPIFTILLLGWLWRIGLLFMLFYRISKLDLALVPAHPDRMGGLGFLEKLPKAFVLVTLAMSAVLASRWIHDSLYHHIALDTLKLPLLSFAILWGLIVLAPLYVFSAKMISTRKKAMRQYSALLAEHGRLIHRKWILGQKVGEQEILDSPELGPSADIETIYAAVKNMRKFPIGKSCIMPILVPIVLPMVIVASTQIPFMKILTTLFKALV
jgi:hypothetical protein